MERVDSVTATTLSKPLGTLGKLGYRGFTVRSSQDSSRGALSLAVHEGIIDQGQGQVNRIADHREIESWLMSSAPDQLVSEEVQIVVTAEIAQGPLDVASYLSTTAVSCPTCVAADAPAYDPGSWNIPSIQPYNNCYNYANNQKTNTFAQPGRAHGDYPYPMACTDVNKAARADGLVDTNNFSTPLASGQGWYVALVIWPGADYHWYRQDNVGCWSHKPGGSAVRDVDNSGNPITDPQTCDRGPYTNWCTYMITNKNVVIR